MELMQAIILVSILVIVITNLFNKEQNRDWRVRAVLSALWFGLAFSASQLGGGIMVVLGAAAGIIDALVAYAFWAKKRENKQ